MCVPRLGLLYGDLLRDRLGITVTLVFVFGKCVAPRDVREQDPAYGPAIDPAKHLNNESMQTNTNMSFRSCGRRM